MDRIEKEITKDGKTTSVSVRKVENGYVTRIRICGDVEGKWEESSKEYVSTTNPLEIQQKEAPKEKSAVDIAAAINKINFNNF